MTRPQKPLLLQQQISQNLESMFKFLFRNCETNSEMGIVRSQMSDPEAGLLRQLFIDSSCIFPPVVGGGAACGGGGVGGGAAARA